MDFEFDLDKSIKNKEKHGIDFEEAKLLWEFDDAVVVPAHIMDSEIRYALISKLNTKCFIAIFTIRNNKYRIISVRRCSKKEEQNYEKNKG